MYGSDETFMRLAIRMGERGLGRTSPNPSVGAVVVRFEAGRPGVILGLGWTQVGGRPHAETEALRQAGAAAKGATLYVTLEPCSHHGRTPPCTDAIIAAGIARAVVAIDDSDARVAGKGYAALAGAGIEVVQGVLAPEAYRALAGHLIRTTHGRPLVQLKLALSADERIAAGTGAPVWVTGSEARADGHLMRAEADCILVGRGTVEADDPELTCRLPGLLDRTPMPVVLDSFARLPLTSKLVRRAASGGLTVAVSAACETDADARHRVAALRAAGVEVLAIAGNPRLDPEALLLELANRGATRVLVEGGPSIWQSLLDAGLADEIVAFQGSAILAETGLPALHPDSQGQRGLARITGDPAWTLAEDRAIGSDRKRVWRRRIQHG